MTQQQDSDSDKIIAGMVASTAAMAVAPGVNTVAFIGAMGAGVVSIGTVYGYTLTKDEGWKLGKQFLQGAGIAVGSAFGGAKVLTMLMATTGIGYGTAVALDAGINGLAAYVIGKAAKEYFKHDRNLKLAQQKAAEAAQEKTKRK
ncbi:DUF697 domain-containing protein [Streptomyces spongiae]|uniref:DUF697 domain-containing protein n=1 Tax=Streptomyces spongiae TaxID=565072 RepID=A0A5N8XWD9_9ACTN|nr:DUF697 domain-containing protein [Streptomyces spongiae]MPY63687.1 DUF697 domain-containing protein [Streptomyces spongiae]